MKKTLVIIAVLLIGFIYVSNQKSKVKYMDMDCPVCYGSEVGDFGYDEIHNQGHHGHCFDCGADFYVEE